MRAAVLVLAAAALAGCATTCPRVPPEPVWALSLVPDDATFEAQTLYMMAELDQREAWGLELRSIIEECRK